MRVAHQLRAISVLREAGMLDLGRPVLIATTALAMRRLGPIAGAAHIAARRNPADLALIDELGGLTHGELDRRANALARAGRRPEYDWATCSACSAGTTAARSNR